MEGADRFEVLDAVLGIMSPRVTVRPSGREFLAEGHDTILAAGLKAGLAFAYGCGNGTCGLCKARVVGGEVRQVRPHDYPLSAAERSQGHVLMCCTAPVADIQIEAIEASQPADIPPQQLVATVRAVTSLAPETRLLHLQTPRTTRLRFLAGQWARLGVTGGQGDAALSLPIASCPCDDRNIHFHVGRDDADPFASRLFAGAIRPGDAVSLSGPAGRFVLDATTACPRVFVACDLGFAPVKSLVEHALASEAATTIDLLWLSTRADGRREPVPRLGRFARRVPLRGVHGRGPVGRRGPAGGGMAAADAAASDVFIAGPEAFVESARVAFGAAGVDETRLHAEVV